MGARAGVKCPALIGASGAVTLGSVVIGAGAFVVVARVLPDHARSTVAAGAQILSCGAFIAGPNPYAFDGVGVEGLQRAADEARVAGAGLVVEVFDEAQLKAVEAVGGVVMIGGAGMWNASLIERAARRAHPLVIGRGRGSSLDEWCQAAERALISGAPGVVMSEGGPDGLDLPGALRIKRAFGVPVLLDLTGVDGAEVATLGVAAGAAGLDGAIVDATGGITSVGQLCARARGLVTSM